MGKIKIAVSSCLLGNEVRYDGTHKYDAYINETLGRYFDFIPYCPEVAIGLGIPRPPIRLEQLDDGIHVRGVYEKERDYSSALANYAEQVVAGLDNVCGYIFKTRSPSCGIKGAGIFNAKDELVGEGSGLYAQEIMNACPEIPVIDEEDLLHPGYRENFLERVIVLRHWQVFALQNMTQKSLMDFHQRHQLIIQAHDEKAYEELLGLLNSKDNLDLANVSHMYLQKLMVTLKQLASCESHANILRLVCKPLKNQMETLEWQELNQLIDDFEQGLLPRTLTVSLLRQYLPLHPDEFILKQHYFSSAFLEVLSGNSNVH